MEKDFFEFLSADNMRATASSSEVNELNELELTLIGGGIGDTVL